MGAKARALIDRYWFVLLMALMVVGFSAFGLWVLFASAGSGGVHKNGVGIHSFFFVLGSVIGIAAGVALPATYLALRFAEWLRWRRLERAVAANRAARERGEDEE